MDKVDSRLKYLQAQQGEALPELERIGRFGLEATETPSPRVTVLLQFHGDLAQIEARGFQTHSVAGNVATGTVNMGQVNEIAEMPQVVQIEVTRPMAPELDVSLAETRANLVHTGPPGHRGAGVIIGIIDSGIDFLHQCFRRTDGTSRILAIWDQGLTPTASESSPSGFTYGVEYTEADINAALASANPASIVRHVDRDTATGHGTHVAGIAAGDGSVAGNGQPAFTFVGAAPEADLIVVANRVTTAAFGDSASTLDGINYIFTQAAAFGRPVVINMSQGDNIGAHDGTSLLEVGIDNLLGGQGRAMVKSAGNEGNRNRHASGLLAAGGTETVRFAIATNDITPDTIDLWYPASDRIGLTVTSPDGNTTAVVNPGNTANLNLPNGNRIFVDSVLNHPANGDNRIFIVLSRGTSGTLQSGTWSLNLRGNTIVSGQFHGWIQRGGISDVAQFLGPHQNHGFTISIPGTSRQVITVASYVTKGAGVGSISSFSSRGPTRDGRATPTLAAPGQTIMSARARNIASGSDQYHLLPGTSMAAPHVAGAIALMLQNNPVMTQTQIRDCLVNRARTDAFTGAVPNNTWGGGKLDAQAAFDCASVRPTLKVLDDPGPTLKFADEPTPTLKFRDEPGPTLKFADEPSPTLKFRDDPAPTLKFADDPGPKTKFQDDPGTSPILDPVKQPGLDQPGGRPPLGRPGLPSRGGEAAPFILATPHHSMAWTQSYPQAYQAMLSQYEAAIQGYQQAFEEINQAYAQGHLSQEEIQEAQQLHQQYVTLLAEYQQLAQLGQAGQAKTPGQEGQSGR